MSEGTSVAAAAGQAYVLDACALLAFLGNEPGAHVIKSLLTDTSNVCMVHAINLCEVYYDLLRQNDAQFAQQAVATLVAAVYKYGTRWTNRFGNKPAS